MPAQEAQAAPAAPALSWATAASEATAAMPPPQVSARPVSPEGAGPQALRARADSAAKPASPEPRARRDAPDPTRPRGDPLFVVISLVLLTAMTVVTSLMVILDHRHPHPGRPGTDGTDCEFVD